MIVVVVIIMKLDHILPLFRIGHFVFLGIGSGYLSLSLSCGNTLSFSSALLQSMSVDPQLSNFNFTQHVSLLISFSQQSKLSGVVKFLLFMIMWCALLLVISNQLVNSWDFLEAVYGVM